MQDMVMINIAPRNKGVIARSLALSKVLYFGGNTYKYFYFGLVVYWLVSYWMYSWLPHSPTMFFIMFMPAILQAILAMMMGIRASSLLLNHQLHFIGIRKELFINLLAFCIFLSLPVYDPKNAENLFNAKLISFAFLSTSMLIMVWLYSLQLLSMLLLFVVVVLALCLIPVLGIKLTLSVWSLIVWGYFAYWLWRSPLQQMFNYENFNNFFDYIVERSKLVVYRKALTRVINKEHVVLMGEGDGYANRIFFSQCFTLIFTSIYVIVMQSSPALSLWIIMMHVGASRARTKLGQSHMKLWMLTNGDRSHQFHVAEILSLRLYGYTFLTGIIILGIWMFIHTQFAAQGLISFCVVQLIVMAADYYNGILIKVGDYSQLISLFFKMAFMFVLALSQLDFVYYVILAILAIIFGLVFREGAKKRFASANLTLRAS